MTGNRFRILLVALATFMLSVFSADCSGELNDQQKSLTGIKLITVHVNFSGLANDVGLDREEVLKTISSQLEGAGIKVVRPQVWSSLPGRCRLKVSIKVYKPQNLDLLIYDLKVEFIQTVTLDRLPETKIDATTWDRTWFAHGTRKRIVDYILLNLKSMTALFIRDHQLANPAEAETADSKDAYENPIKSTPHSEVKELLAGYIASKNSDVFHKSDCRWAQNITTENLVKYGDRNEAIKAGKRPCKRCNP